MSTQGLLLIKESPHTLQWGDFIFTLYFLTLVFTQELLYVATRLGSK